MGGKEPIAMTLDGNILLWIQTALRQEWMNSFWLFVTRLGDRGTIWLLTILVLCCFKKTRKTAVYAFISLAFAFLLGEGLLKHLIARPRPFDMIPDLVVLGTKPGSYSCPSGHTMSSFATAWIYYLGLDKKIGIPAMILAGLIGISRLYIGVHYPTDVLLGFILATGVSYFVFQIMKKRGDA